MYLNTLMKSVLQYKNQRLTIKEIQMDVANTGATDFDNQATLTVRAYNS